MDALTKIFIAEPDCERLVNTMLWLEQYPDFEVYGTSDSDGSLTEQIEAVQPDVVMLGMPTASGQAAFSIKGIRATSVSPAVMIVLKSENNVDMMLAECDGQIGPKTSLKEMPELIRKAINRRMPSSVAAITLQMAKAG